MWRFQSQPSNFPQRENSSRQDMTGFIAIGLTTSTEKMTSLKFCLLGMKLGNSGVKIPYLNLSSNLLELSFEVKIRESQTI